MRCRFGTGLFVALLLAHGGCLEKAELVDSVQADVGAEAAASDVPVADPGTDPGDGDAPDALIPDPGADPGKPAVDAVLIVDPGTDPSELDVVDVSLPDPGTDGMGPGADDGLALDGGYDAGSPSDPGGDAAPPHDGDANADVPSCIPDCSGKECGDDGCGGGCAPGCSPPAVCDLDAGLCACLDACPAAGASRCNGSVPETCTAGGGCLYWAAAADCAGTASPDCMITGGVAGCEASPPSAGIYCDDAGIVPVELSDGLPLAIFGQTTSGFGAVYNSSCMKAFDAGEDSIYQLTVDSETALRVSLDPGATPGTGIALDSSCPPGGACLAFSTVAAAEPHSLPCVLLTPGTYFLQVDSTASPSSIASFSLSFESCGCTPGALRCSPGGSALETCAADGYTWATEACEFGCDDADGQAACVSCMDGCAQGDVRCAGEAVEVCASGALGCLEWQLDAVCADPTPWCDPGSTPPACTADPDGDYCEVPLVIEALPYSSGVIDTADADLGAAYDGAGCAVESAAANDVAFTMVAPTTGFYEVSIEDTATFDTTLYVVGDCGDIAGTCFGGDDQPGTGGESLTVMLAQDEIIYIIVDGADGADGLFELEVVLACAASCEGVECGDDGCGQSCGSCGPGLICDATSQLCVCEPKCPGLGSTTCAGSLLKTCVADAEGCLDWDSGTDCAATSFPLCAEFAFGASCKLLPTPASNCADPDYVAIDLPAMFPLEIAAQTTCGAGDEFGYYDGCKLPGYPGEEVVYTIKVHEEVAVQFQVDPHLTNHGAIALGSSCPPNGDSCIVDTFNHGSSPFGTECTPLSAGIYYLMISGGHYADCMAVFDLWAFDCSCVEGEKSCMDATTLATCAADNQTWIPETCPAYCSESYPTAHCASCLDVCTLGETRCLGAELQTCQQGPCTEFVTVEDCWSSGQFCDDSTGPAQCTDAPPVWAAGSWCEDPALTPIQIPDAVANGPLVTDTLTTCGTGDHYTDTCLDSCPAGWGDCDGSNDLIVELAVAEATSVIITLDPTPGPGISTTGVALNNVCPPSGSCEAMSINQDQGPHSTPCTLLEPGAHFIMVDMAPGPYCIPEFSLTIEDCS